MAEGILKKLILDAAHTKDEILPIDVTSAGIHAVDGFPAAGHAREAAAGHGIDLLSHRSKTLTGRLIRRANLILAMEKAQADHILAQWPGLVNVHEVRGYGRKEHSLPWDSGIEDPIGGSLEDYLRTFDELRQEIVRIAGFLFPLIRDTYGPA